SAAYLNTRSSGTLGRPARENLTFINPALHTDDSIGGVSLGETIIDIRAQCVQWKPALQIPFGTRDFCAVQAAAHADLDALRTETQCRINGLSHRAAESDSLFQLHRNGLGDKLRIEFRSVDFLNIDIDLTIRPLLDVGFELVDFSALTADDDTGPRRVDRDTK